MMQEVFRQIEGFDGYEVSNMGNIKSPRKIKKPFKHRDGYLLIGLLGKKNFYVHRLVAQAFIQKIEGKDFVNHLNGNKADNRVENLEWCTKSENSKHSFETGLQDNRGEMHPLHILTENDVIEIRRKFKPRLYTREMLSSEYGVKPSTIKAIVLNRIWKHVA